MPRNRGGGQMPVVGPRITSISQLLGALVSPLCSAVSRVCSLSPLPANLVVSIAGVMAVESVAVLLIRRTSGLKKRYLVIREITEVLERWEEVCIREVLQCGRKGCKTLEGDEAVLQQILGSQHALWWVHHLWSEGSHDEGVAWGSSASRAEFNGTQSLVFSSDFTLARFIALCFMGHQELYTEADKTLLARLDFVVQYGVFRWLCAVEESRWVRGMWATRSGRSDPASPTTTGSQKAFAANLWRLTGAPSWILPLDETQEDGQTVKAFIPLPWSYLPVETLMINKSVLYGNPVLEELMPLWHRSSVHAVRKYCQPSLFGSSSSLGLSGFENGKPLKRKEVCRLAAYSLVHCWFHLYGQKTFLSTKKMIREEEEECYSEMVWGQPPALLLRRDGSGSCPELPRPHQRKIQRLLVMHGLTTALSTCLSALSLQRSTAQLSIRGASKSIAWFMVTLVINAGIRRVSTRIEAELDHHMLADISEMIYDKLISSDHAFFDRWTTSGNVQTENLIDYCYAIKGKFDQHVRRWTNVISLSGLAWYNGDLLTLLVAVLDTHLRQIRFNRLRELSKTVNLDATKTGTGKFGLAVLAEALADTLETKATEAGVATISYPILSLVACSGVSGTELWDPKKCALIDYEEGRQRTLVRSIRVERLYETLSGDLRIAPGNALYPLKDSIESMKLSVRYIHKYKVKPWRKQASWSNTNASETKGSAMGPASYVQGKPRNLDPEEHEVFLDSTKYRNVPLLNRRSGNKKLMLKQLGLETIATFKQLDEEKAAGGSRRFGVRESIDVFLTQAKQLKFQSLHVLSVVALTVITVTKVRVRRGGSPLLPLPVVEYTLDYHAGAALLERHVRFQHYGNCISSSYSSDERSSVLTFVLNELLHHCPCTISDNSTFSSSEQMMERRRVWREHLESNPQTRKLIFDDQHRIIGGLCLNEGIRFQNVTFMYPQLHRHVDEREVPAYTEYENEGSSPRSQTTTTPSPPPPPPATTEAPMDAVETTEAEEPRSFHKRGKGGSRSSRPGAPRASKAEKGDRVKPVLNRVNIAFPAAAMTAVIGRTGAGKSTIFLLLKRIYDPLPIIKLKPQRKFIWREEMLREVVETHWKSNLLPLPPGHTGMGVCEDDDKYFTCEPGYVSFDGIPAACFSVRYLRQWLVQMEQSPAIVKEETFMDNIRFIYSGVRQGDVQRAAEASRSIEFIDRKPLKMMEKVVSLSGGEQQRLGLARSLALVYSQMRQFRLSRSFMDSHRRGSGDDGMERGAFTVAGLLLDEPTSRLDVRNELLVEAAIDELMHANEKKTKGVCSTKGVGDGNNAETYADNTTLTITTTTNNNNSNDGNNPTEAPLVEQRSQDPAASDQPDAHDGSLMIVIIAHRLTTIQGASHVVVISDGSVEAEGTPAHVFAVSGFAKKQLELQFVQRQGGDGEAGLDYDDMELEIPPDDPRDNVLGGPERAHRNRVHGGGGGRRGGWGGGRGWGGMGRRHRGM